jgi:hypothetical protein
MSNPSQQFVRDITASAAALATPEGEPGPSAEEAFRSVRKAAVITAGVGLAHSVLLIVAFLLIRGNAPGTDATDAEIIEFVQDENRRRLVLGAGIYLIPFAGIAFIWFTVSLRMWLAGSIRLLTPLFSNILLACGIVYVVLLFAAGAALSVSAAIAEYEGEALDATDYREFPIYGSSLMLVFAMRMAAMMIFALSTIGRTSGVLPRWFAYLGYVLGVGLLLTASLSPVIVLLFPLWLLVLSVLLLRRARNIPENWTLVTAEGAVIAAE